MKRNITINLFGTLYNIDEDAYELLKNYQDNMRSYFASREGGEEIADDIEHRVAEIFAELKAQGVEAITIDHVENIIHRIGNPEQLDDAESPDGYEEPLEPEAGAAGEDTVMARCVRWMRTHKLYRDPQQKMVAGVLSGLSHYFGVRDALLFRILTILLCFASFGTVVVAYVILCLLVPEAVTAEQRLEMLGKPVNPQTLNEEIVRGARTNAANATAASPRMGSSLLVTLAKVPLWCIKGLLIVLCCCLVAAAAGGMAFLIVLTICTPAELAQRGLVSEVFAQAVNMLPAGIGWMAWIMGIAAMIVVSIPTVLVIRWVTNSNQNAPSRATYATLTLSWFISLGIGICMLVLISLQMENASQQIWRERHRQEVELYDDDSDFVVADTAGVEVVESESEAATEVAKPADTDSSQTKPAH